MRTLTPLASFPTAFLALIALVGHASGALPNDAPPGAAPTLAPVTSSTIAAGGQSYAVYDCADPASKPKAFRVVIPEGLRTVQIGRASCRERV